jgi:heme exporter protein A
MLCGLSPPTRGEILWRGERIETQRETYAGSFAYVGHRSAVKDEMTTLENLLVACAMSGFELTQNEAREALRHVSLNQHENVRVRHLSEGQRRRLALARLVKCERPLWLLDEVMTSLDARAAGCIADLIDAHITSGGMVVIATHQDLKLSSSLLRRIELAA